MGSFPGGIFFWTEPSPVGAGKADRGSESAESLAVGSDSSSQEGAASPELSEHRERESLTPATDSLSQKQVIGRLVGKAGALAGIEVDLLYANDKRIMQSAWKGVSDSDGNFVAYDIPAESYRIALTGDGIPRGWEFKEFTKAEGRGFDLGDLRVPSAGSLHGRVLS